MYETLNKQTLAFGKQFTDNMIKAQGVALKTFEQISGVQAKALEQQAAAHAEFASEAGKANDFDAIRDLWSKSTDFTRTSAENLYSAQQDVMAIAAKGSQSLTELAREQYEAGNEAVSAAPKAAKKASK